MNPTIEELTRAAEQEAKKRLEVLRLMTHPGVGPLTALAFVLIIGTPERFKCGKQIGSHWPQHKVVTLPLLMLVYFLAFLGRVGLSKGMPIVPALPESKS
jgi:Transposase IS116/IS110/IS902 family